MKAFAQLRALYHGLNAALFVPSGSVAEFFQVRQSGFALIFGDIDALKVDPAEAGVVNVELLLERVALFDDDGAHLVDEHANVECQRNGRNGHVSCGIVRGMHHKGRMQEEPRNRHGNNHVHRKGTHAVLRVSAALDEKRRDGARSQQHQAAVHGAVGHAVVRVSEVPQVVADDPEPQLVGPHEVLLFAATHDNAEETADADGV